MDSTRREPEPAEHGQATDFDLDGVRELLHRAAAQLEELERDGVRRVGESVNAVVDEARASGEELVSAAAAEAEAIRAAARNDAKHMIGDAESRVEEILAQARRDARDHSARVINSAQRRLDQLLAAEREVHERIEAAMADIRASLDQVGVSQPSELALSSDGPDHVVDAPRKTA